MTEKDYLELVTAINKEVSRLEEALIRISELPDEADEHAAYQNRTLIRKVLSMPIFCALIERFYEAHKEPQVMRPPVLLDVTCPCHYHRALAESRDFDQPEGDIADNE